ncbi:GM24001 [Drosophila sechellia]|uniref:GM24001 n=1 Tax=Drosophila sechellia TaxID=7238 RepID=B4HHG6_DROSE|nr:GM24001 [Drosophila sechellia]
MPNDSLPPRSFGNFIMRIFTVHKTGWGTGGVAECRDRTSLTAAQQIEIKIYVHMFEFIARLWVPGIQTPPAKDSTDPEAGSTEH